MGCLVMLFPPALYMCSLNIQAARINKTIYTYASCYYIYRIIMHCGKMSLPGTKAF